MSWRTTADAAEFFAGAGDYLRADPVENTLLLTIADQHRDASAAHASAARAPAAPGRTGPLFGWWTGTGAGAFVHTPGWPVVLASMTETAAVALADLLIGQRRMLVGVNGISARADAFAAQWQQSTGPRAGSQVFQRQRLFRLGELTPPAPPPPGQARLAIAADRDLLAAWNEAFYAETQDGLRRLGSSGGPAVLDRRLGYGGLLVWEAGGELVAMAARTPVVSGMSRVAPVYTPPAQRGKGYGGAITVATSQAARAAGAREVVLFTDLANPTSNALYQRLGFRPVSDRLVLSFTA
jgi:predicted GNAT family acetyltransferase